MPDFQRLLARYLVGGPNEKGDVRGYCAVHEDPAVSESPSAGYNFIKDLWNCMSCGAGGTLGDLVRELRRERRKAAGGGDVPPRVRRRQLGWRSDDDEDADVVDLSERRSRGQLPTEEDVAKWHDRLMKQPRWLSIMTDERGLVPATLAEFQIGHDGRRYTIPVRDADGELVNVRKYDPKAAASKDKMLNWSGFGEVRLFRPDLLAGYDECVITEGEMDMILAHQYGIPAVTHTAGAGTFKPEWGPAFEGKRVFICYDVDDPGRAGAKKAARVLAPHARSVHLLQLPIKDLKGADITDYFIKYGYSADDFRELMLSAAIRPYGTRRMPEAAPIQGKLVTVEESMSTAYDAEPVEMIVAISGKQQPPYILPKKFQANCGMDKGNVCQVCPMLTWNGEHVDEIGRNDPVLLDFVDANDKVKNAQLRRILQARCADHISYEVLESWSVEELIVSNSVDHRGDENAAPVSRRVLNVGTYRTPINTTARIVGQQRSDPKTQRGLFLSWYLEPTQTNLDRFTMDKGIARMLKRFQVADGQSPLEKCYEISSDLAANVTRIYGRPELHTAYDLVWHSVMSFDFLGQRVERGWLELLVMGDTRTGKSEAATQLSRHYNAGVIKSCEGATFAGIVGGVQQMGQKWMVTWGIIPLNDRRLVVLDEVSGLKDKDVLENMSSIRSSGKAQLTKIAQEETSARTRLIWISNPVDGRRLHESNGSAMLAIAKLVPNPEDIARFDFAMAAAGNDVDADLINTAEHPYVPHVYTNEACEHLVMWAWSRTTEQIVFGEGVEQFIVETAVDLGSRYVADPPLIQIENVRVKLARLAVAFAARTFSTDETHELVIVKPEHVSSAVDFLDAIYGSDAMGYARRSRRILNDQRRAQEQKSQAHEFLRDNLRIRKALAAVGDNTFRNRDLMDWSGMDAMEAAELVSRLDTWRMIRRLSRGAIRMEQTLMEILREFEDEEDEA